MAECKQIILMMTEDRTLRQNLARTCIELGLESRFAETFAVAEEIFKSSEILTVIVDCRDDKFKESEGISFLKRTLARAGKARGILGAIPARFCAVERESLHQAGFHYFVRDHVDASELAFLKTVFKCQQRLPVERAS